MKIKQKLLPVSKEIKPYNVFLVESIMMFISLLANNLFAHLVILGLQHASIAHIYKWSPKHTFGFTMTCLIFTAMGQTYLGVLFTRLVSLIQITPKHRYQKILQKFILSYLDTLGELSFTIHNPLVGANSDIFKIDWDNFLGGLSSISILETRAIRLRPLGLAPTYALPPSNEYLPPSKIKDIAMSAITTLRFALISILSILIIMRHGFLPLCGLALWVGSHYHQGVEVKHQQESRGPPLSEGIYRIRSTFCGLCFSNGIGVVYNNILHTPYHVTRGAPLRIGNITMKPYYIDIDDDLNTYGGPPSFDDIPNVDKIYVNTESDTSRVTYEMEYSQEDGVLTWPGVTKPGESGSPIFAYKPSFSIEESPKLVLIALAGRYVLDGDNVTEYTTLTPTYLKIDVNIQAVIKHPGFGKTRRIVPNLITAGLRTGRVIVAGPTRTVAQELFKSIRKRYFCSLLIKNSAFVNRTANIQITTHATALSMLLNNDPSFQAASTFILDEAHMDDASTITLRRYLRSGATTFKNIYELSATLDGVFDGNSNYPIDNKHISKRQIIEVISGEVEADHKVLVFVPSIKNELVENIVNSFPGKVVCLSRQTFDTVYPTLMSPNTKVIVATNIAEVGLNIPDLDAVIDTGESFTYICEGDPSTSGRILPINTASHIQRRGRVGRVKPGTYYYCHPPSDRDVITSAQLDADIICTGRPWSNITDNPLGVTLTPEQLRWYFDPRCSLTPWGIHLKFSPSGAKREPNDVLKLLRAMEDPSLPKRTCRLKPRNTACSCERSWSSFDEREHDAVLKLYN